MGKTRIDMYKEMVTEDLKIDKEVLNEESNRTPELHGKYLGFLLDESVRLNALKSKLKQMRVEKWEYYSGKAPAEVYKERPFHLKLLKSDIPMYVDADEEIRALEDKISMQETLVKYLEGVVQAVTNRNWNIRNSIEFLKFKNGLI